MVEEMIMIKSSPSYPIPAHISALTYLSDGLEHLLLMRVHLGEGSDLCQVDTLPVAQGHHLVKGKDQRECLLDDF